MYSRIGPLRSTSAASRRFTTSFSRARSAICCGSRVARAGRCSAAVMINRSSSPSATSAAPLSIHSSSPGDRIWPIVSGAIGTQSS